MSTNTTETAACGRPWRLSALLLSTLTLSCPTPSQSRELIFGGGNLLAHDAARDRIVSLGRLAHPHVEWNGSSWIDPAGTAVPPGPGTLAFDRVGQRLMFFGGSTTFDTWAFDGRAWTNLAVVGPPARLTGTLLWHAARAKVIWIGDTTQGFEAWEWTGTIWQPVSVATVGLVGPFAATYDAARQSVLLLGFDSQRQVASTAEWGSTWTAYGDRTPAFAAPLLAFEPGRGRVVWVDPGSSLMREWNGSQWVNPTSAPDGLGALADAGPHGVAALDATGALHYLQGSQWSLVSDVPSSREGHAVAFDRAGGSVLLFGGGVATWPVGSNDTWSFDGERWRLRRPAHSPAARQWHAMASTPVGIVMSGGVYRSTLLGDSWLWTGADWQSVPGAPARAGHAIAAWRGSASAVMFGGGDSTGVTDATYEFRVNFSTMAWVAVSPANRPPARSGHGMAYDTRRNRVVLFGGSDGAGAPLGDTWEWDGSNWLPMSPPLSPSPRFSHAMYYDSVRGQVVVRGGVWSYPPDAWEWNGSTWTQIASPAAPALLEAPIAFDERRGRAVYVPRFESLPPPSPLAAQVETWLFADGAAATSVAYGTGCGGSTVPALLPVGDPFLGHAGFGLDVLLARGNAGAVLLVGAGLARIALGGGCDLLVDPTRLVLTAPLTTNTAGFANLPLPIPYAPALVGATLFTQAFVADPAGPVLGLAATDGRQLFVGR